MISTFDDSMLRRATRVALRGRGRVEPNPVVGCVIVRDGDVIGEGCHARFGGPHAEPNALDDCRTRGHDPRGATAYVTLEPCCHTNKQTPPCAPRLIEAGLARVVIGCLDANPHVNGGGVAMLRAAGITVDVAPPALEAEFRQLIAPFLAAIHRPGPYVTLKWAQSRNGLVGGPGGTPVRITGEAATLAVHRLRTRCHGIAVGVGTVISDDPSLTVRGVPVINTPARYVFDRHLRMPSGAKLLTDDGPPTTVLCDDHVAASRAANHAIDVDNEIIDAGDFDGRAIVTAAAFAPLHGRHLLVEPGPALAASFLPWADRLWVFTSSVDLPDGDGVPHAAAIPASYVEAGRLTLGPDTLVEYLNRDSAAFVTAAPSADFMLETETAAAANPPV